MFRYLFPSTNKPKKKLVCHAILMRWNTYYQGLSPAMKKVFIMRTLYFIRKIDFTTSPEIKLTPEIQVLVASGFIQITFGLKRYRLRNFERIHIAHKPYAYKNIGILYHGDTNPKTAQINLVWSVVEKGFKIPNDALNLSIHEFSHALILDNKERMSLRKFYKHKVLIKYLLAAKIEMHRIRDGYDSIFREYGATNLMEFFAVSVEVFFEQTDKFSIDNPLLFERLCTLLRQDPRLSESPRI